MSGLLLRRDRQNDRVAACFYCARAARTVDDVRLAPGARALFRTRTSSQTQSSRRTRNTYAYTITRRARTSYIALTRMCVRVWNKNADNAVAMTPVQRATDDTGIAYLQDNENETATRPARTYTYVHGRDERGGGGEREKPITRNYTV